VPGAADPPTDELCSALSRAAGEPRGGTAPHARVWVLLEQPGPWGRDAVHDSHLESEVAEPLAALAEPGVVRVGLIRAAEHHADRHPARRTLLVARTDPGATWLSSRSITALDALTGFDVQACLSSTTPPENLPGAHNPSVESALLVCTNARRDRCCALLGRPLAAELAAHPNTGTAVWETSHLSGHRFAPTYLSLPDGYLYAGPDATERTLASCRGRSSLPAAAQAAELAVLQHLGVPRPYPLATQAAEDGCWEITADGQRFVVAVETRPVDRIESCGKEAVASHQLVATIC
jgi:hypothetical protein